MGRRINKIPIFLLMSFNFLAGGHFGEINGNAPSQKVSRQILKPDPPPADQNQQDEEEACQDADISAISEREIGKSLIKMIVD